MSNESLSIKILESVFNRHLKCLKMKLHTENFLFVMCMALKGNNPVKIENFKVTFLIAQMCIM